LYLVAKYIAVQTRLRQEIMNTVDGQPETATDNAELPYAEMVIQESLRLYPPNWALIPRRCVRKSTIGDYRIPRGSWLYIFPYVIHRDARWFESPESFDPDRFLPERFRRAHRSAYIPLGLGPHVCIGKALSTIILTSMLARILQEFRLELLADQTKVEPEVRVVIRPANGLPLVANRLELAKCDTDDRAPIT
jgi:cytochrome P450